jgi:single-strand DNA-binding protein
MVNEASFSVAGYVATEPKSGWTKDGTRTLFMRLGWTPRRMNKTTGDWADQPSSFVSVICYRKVAENAALCLRRGDPVVVKGSLRVREFGEQGSKRIEVEVTADTLGHDLSRGTSFFKKSTSQLEKTAAEREQEQIAAAARQPLPGDRQAGEFASPEPGEGYPVSGDLDPAAGEDYPVRGDLEPAAAEGYPVSGDLESAASEEFDEEEARQMLADAGDASEPVGAAS